MKPLKFLSVFAVLLLSTINAISQTYYYNVPKTFQGNVYTYQCDEESPNAVILYNKANRFTYTKWTYRDGSPIGSEIRKEYYTVDLVEDETWTKPKCDSIVNGAFSAEEKARVKDYFFMVRMTIDTDTGRVIEVDFSFINMHPFGTIPISVYRKIELDLKNNIWFTLTADGRKLNFTRIGWMHKVK